MQLMKLLHTLFKRQLPSVHKMRLDNLIQAVITVIRFNRLSLSALGRNLSNQNKPRSNIKKIDRMLGNAYLQNELPEFYRVMASHLIKELSPWIHVDWSCICSLTNLYLLRASLSMSGRSIIIYEECHPKKNENNHSTHKSFLKRLKAILPATVKPVIVTDAGFRGVWFSEICSMGWDFVGRLRNKNRVSLNEASSWQISKELYQGAKSKPKYLGYGVLTQKLKVAAHFVLYKGKNKKRYKLNKDKTRSHSGKSKRYARSHAEPWLLVTSLSHVVKAPHYAVTIYRQRMRIEENIRDTKSNRYGFGLNESRTRTPKEYFTTHRRYRNASMLDGLYNHQKERNGL